jgi:Zn-dependent protease with chaperone function
MSATETFALLMPVMLVGWLASQLFAAATIKWFSGVHLSPRVRQRRTLMVIAFSFGLPVTLALALWAAHVMPSENWMNSHCGVHSHHHIHACLDTTFAATPGVGYLIIAALTALLLASAMIRKLWQGRVLNRQLGSLLSLSKGQGRLRVVDDDRVLALAVGGSTPAVMLSKGLILQLSLHQRRIVLAHECAHLRHGDHWRNNLVELWLVLFLPPISRQLRQIWRNALEQDADDAVTQRFDPVDVAQTLLHVLSLQTLHVRGALSVLSGDAEIRIRRLLAGPDRGQARAVHFEWICAAILPAIITGAFVQHHAIETALGLFAGGLR